MFQRFIFYQTEIDMKRALIILAMVALFTGCATQFNYPRQTTITFMDFRPYTSAGFFFSADPYPEKYSPVGQLLIEIIPARTLTGVEMPTSEELLETAYNEAKAKGANGISNFSVKIDDTYTSVSSAPSGSGKYNDGVYPGKNTSWVQTKRITLSGTLIKTGQ